MGQFPGVPTNLVNLSWRKGLHPYLQIFRADDSSGQGITIFTLDSGANLDGPMTRVSFACPYKVTPLKLFQGSALLTQSILPLIERLEKPTVLRGPQRLDPVRVPAIRVVARRHIGSRRPRNCHGKCSWLSLSLSPSPPPPHEWVRTRSLHSLSVLTSSLFPTHHRLVPPAAQTASPRRASRICTLLKTGTASSPQMRPGTAASEMESLPRMRWPMR